MELVSQGVFRVANVVWRPGHGGFAFTVVCKATFALTPGVSPLAAEQEPVALGDVYAGEAGALTVASDLVPTKRRPEVLLTGHAYAPEGQPVRSLVARLAVGEIVMSLHLVGDRLFAKDGRLGEPAEFARMPLGWERAAGAMGTSNPVGRSLDSAARTDMFGRVAAPNLLPPGTVLTSRRDSIAPVGFGPISPLWAPRAALLPRHLAGWDPARWHERPLPADLDPGYFNVAPPDQQRTLPFGEEAILLEGLNPRFARLSTQLERVDLTATIDHGAGPRPLELRCDTLSIDTDREIAMLVWRADVLMDRIDGAARVVVSTRAVAPKPPFTARRRDVAAEEITVVGGGFQLSSTALPFSSAASPPLPSAIPPAVAVDHSAPGSIGATSAPVAAKRKTVTLTMAPVVAAPVLPFAPSLVDGTPRHEAAPAASASVLPFKPSPTSEAGDGPATQRGPTPPELTPLQATGLPFAAGPCAPSTTPARAVVFSWAQSAEPRFPVAPLPVERAEQAPPDEPRHLEPQPGVVAGDRASEAGELDAPAPAEERAKEITFEAYPPERCGVIAARLSCDEAAAADILRAEGLDGAQWQRVHAHWLDRIRDDAQRSKKKLLADYDAAHVGALEAQRGAISVRDYAQLAEAAERSVVATALAARGLPDKAWPHIHRVWIGRMVKDVQLSKQIRSEITALRATG